MKRYTVREEIEINAPVQQVYAVATDPALVPRYVPEITRIEVLQRLNDNQHLVRSHIKVGWFSIAYLYRYRYIPSKYYGGVQEKGKLFRGYFGLRFRPREEKTVVIHTEGIESSIPGMAAMIGFIYFRVLARGATCGELKRLKELSESGAGIKKEQGRHKRVHKCV
jgi:uncharacterized membrane protein